MILQGFAQTSLDVNGELATEANMSAQLRIGLTFFFFFFYCGCAVLSFKFGPEPMRLDKGKWSRMKKPDYSIHYLEWVSILHALSCLVIGSYIVYHYGHNYNRKTLYCEYLMTANSCGYFIYDTLAEWYYETFDAGMVAHHLASIALTVFTLYEHYGGCAMFNGLYFAEWSGPCFIIRCAFKRQNLETTKKYLYAVTLYSICYYFSRGIGYSLALYPIARARYIPFYLKAIFMPALFLSYGWMILITAMLWKTLPNWSKNPKEVEKSGWWLAGRSFFKKYTKDSPWVYISTFIMALLTCIMPLTCAYIVHYVDPSWGTTT